MALSHYSTPAQDHLGELAAVFSSLDDAALLARLQDYRLTGRPGYPLKALWRAYVAWKMNPTSAISAASLALCPIAPPSTASSNASPTMPTLWSPRLPTSPISSRL